MTRAERQARDKHPKLYALGQHTTTKFLGKLFWTARAQKVAKKHGRRTRTYTRSYRSSRAHATVIYNYGTINF